MRCAFPLRPSSDDWLDTEYKNQYDPASFLTVYGEQSAAANGGEPGVFYSQRQ